jgi:hypothetical protein
MKKTLMFFSITFFVGLIAILIFPYYTINPGVLVKGHFYLRNHCFACHSLAKGAPKEKCIVCHNSSDVGLKTVAGVIIINQNSKTNLLHKSIKDIKCYYCHTEHNGFSKENATINFTHTVLSQQMLKECVGCHSDKKPYNNVHKTISSDCSFCHYTENWKHAEFKHELLGKKKSDCKNCHTNKIPYDDLHKDISINVQCVQCHNTKSWKPVTFEHTKYFRFDSSHPSDCTKCHNAKDDFKSYTCYNCHEHQFSRISEKHLEEGIRDFNNCVKCHRSGDENEVKGNRSEHNRGNEGEEN